VALKFPVNVSAALRAIDSGALLTGIPLYRHFDAFQRNIPAFRLPKRSQCRARAKRCVVEIMGIGPRPAAPLLDAEVAGEAMSADVDLVPHRRQLISHY
jgi:hypothetical protein